MLRGLLAFTALFVCVQLSAQEQLTTDYFPTPGDTIRFNIADSTWAAGQNYQLDGGADLFWDFSDPVSQVEVSSPVSVADNPAFPSATIVIEDNFFTTRYFRIEDETFKLVGASTRAELFPDVALDAALDIALAERYSDVRPGDVFTSRVETVNTIPRDSIPPEALALFPAQILLVDSIRITVVSERRDSFDAFGTVKLGDNFYSTIREVRREVTDTKVEVTAGFIPWFDATEEILDSDPSLAEFLGPQAPVVTYLWWNNDSKEPIVELTTDAEGNLTTMNYKRALEATSTGGPESSQAMVTLYPNPARDLVAYEIEGLPGGQYQVVLTNMLGKQVAVRKFAALGNQTKLTLDVNNYPSGQYIVSLRNSRGRIVSARRLIVR